MAPSSIVVTDRASLSANFAANSKSVLCSAAFGAGAYAIGGSFLGFPPLTPAAALVTGGSLLAALALCPSSADSDAIFGTPPDFLGGQCLVDYTVSVRLEWRGTSTGILYASSASRGTTGRGPFSGLEEVVSGRTALARLKFADRNVDFGGQNFPTDETLTISNVVWENISRVDGLPDSCGNAPSSGGQVITNPVAGDTIDNSKVVNNSNYSLVVPVEFNLGGINNTLNLRFGDIRIGSLLPLNFRINIGGADFEFGEKPDGDLEPRETNPDKEGASDRIEQLLKGIQSCVCKPEVEMDLLYLPLVDSKASCDIVSAEFLVPKGSVSSGLVDSFISSAILAKAECGRESPEQLPESPILVATTGSGGAEIFTEKIAPEVVSLRVEITDFNEEILPKISLYPDSNQRKFGSVNYCSDSGSGGGDYIYVFDNSTYVPLPKRAKDGRLRVLFKPGTSFIIYDTGERF